jgi:anti-anti-sigma factor
MSEFEIAIEPAGEGTVVLAVSGEVDLKTAADLDVHLRAALGDGHSKVVLDLTRCEFFDSSGLNVLARAQRRLDGKTVSVVIPPNGITRQAFEITGFQLLFPIYSSREDALDSLVEKLTAEP